jgi:hypothetical protein
MKARAAAHETPSRLLAQLVHETSVLVRSELELAAAERLPAFRRLGNETAAALAAAVASCLAFACLTWAAARAADLVLPGWAAPLAVAGGWLLIAASLLPRRHLRRALRADPAEISRSAGRTRATAEQAVRETAERLAEAAARHAAARELKFAAGAVEHAVGGAEADARYLLKELTAAVSAGGRAGIGVLERVIGRNGS